MPIKPARILNAQSVIPETAISAMPHTGAKQIEAAQEKPLNLPINAKGAISATSNRYAKAKVNHICSIPQHSLLISNRNNYYILVNSHNVIDRSLPREINR